MNEKDLTPQSKQKNDYWFLRVAMQASIFTAAFIAYSKIKGPVGDLLSTYTENQINRNIKREEFKSFYDDSILETRKSSFYTYSKEAPKQFNEDLGRNTYGQSKVTASRLRKKALSESEQFETKIFSQIKYDIKTQGALIKALSPTFTEANFSIARLIKLDEDELFFEVRRKTLLAYLAKNNEISNYSLSEIKKLDDPEKDKLRIKSMHLAYLKRDPSYANEYNSGLKSFKSNYIKNKWTKRTRVSRPGSVEEAKEMGLGDIHTGYKEMYSPAQRMVMDRLLAKHRPTVLSQEDIWKELSAGKKYTSSSLAGSMDFLNGDIFKLAGKFDYTNDIKNLIRTVMDLDAQGDKTGLSKLFVEIVTEGSMGGDQFTLKITGRHTASNRDYSIKIPLAQNGFVPASNAAGRERHDFMIPRTYGKVGKNIEDFLNSGQLLLQAAEKSLKSAIMNSAASEPFESFKRVQNTLDNLLEPAARLEGTARDAITGMIILPMDKRVSNKLKFERSFNSLDVFRQMSRNRSNGAINITIDLETITPGRRTGPEINAVDAKTQIREAAFSVAEMDYRGKYRILDMQNNYSAHGIEIVDGKVSGDMLQMLVKALPDKIRNGIPVDATPDDLFRTWANYHKGISNPNFHSNKDIASAVIKQILQVVDQNAGKPIYITTKFGTGFDLKLLEIWAPNEYAELRRRAPHLDLQGISHLKQISSGSTDSISQSQLLKTMMKSYDPSREYDFDNKKDLHDALNKLAKGNHTVFSNNLINKIKGMKDLSAHNAGVDTIMLQALLGWELNDYRGNGKSFDSSVDFLRSQFNKFHRFKSMEEQYNETLGLERTEVLGFMASATGLSHGLVAKQYLSLMATRHFLLNPDVPVTKQWNQMLAGATTVLGKNMYEKLSSNGQLDLKAVRKILFPSIATAGELDATSYGRKADAMKNLFSNTVNVRYFAVLGMQENVHRLSEDVLTKANLYKTAQINLSEVAGPGGETNLSNKVLAMKREIELEAKKIAAEENGGRTTAPTETHYQAAAYRVNAREQYQFTIPASTRLLASSGSRGSTTIKAPVDGKVRNIRTSFQDNELTIYADVEYYLNAKSGEPNVVRGASGKLVGVFDKFVTEKMMYGEWAKDKNGQLQWNDAVKGYGPAQFLEKEYWGSMKTIIMRNGMENLFDSYENAKGKDKEKIRKTIEKWSAQFNSNWNQENNMLKHNSYKEGNFKKIGKFLPNGSLNPRWNDAQKVIGSIDLNIEKLHSFMIDTGHVWTQEQAETWYRSWDSKGGTKALNNFYESEITKVKLFYDKPTGDLGDVILDMDSRTREHYKQQHIKLLGDFILPDMERVKAGKAAKFFESREKIKGTGIYDIGVMLTDAMSFYGQMTGTHGRSTNIKLRRSVLGQVANFEFVTTDTRDMLNAARRSRVEGLAESVAATRTSFIDTMFGEMVVGKRLSTSDISKILDLRNGLDINKLKRLNLDDAQRADLVKSMEAIVEGFSNSQEMKEEAKKIIMELERDDHIKSITSPDNKTWATLDYAQSIHQLGIDPNRKGLWALDLDENADAIKKYGLLDFDIEKILRTFPDQAKINQHIPSKSILHNMFSTMSKVKGGAMVDTISLDKNKVKLKNIIMRAQVHQQSVINLLTKPGEEQGLGIITQEMKSVNEVLRAYKEFTDIASTEKKIGIEESVSMFQKQYLSHMLRQFINVDEDEIDLKGFTARSIDSHQLYLRLHEIKKMGGFGKIDGFKTTKDFTAQMADEWGDRILKGFHMSDAFVHEDFHKKNMDYNYRENKNIQAKNHFDMFKNKYGEEAAQKMVREQAFYGDVIRYPVSPAGHLPMLATRFNIVPKEVAGYLGIDVNVMAVSAEYWKLVRGDNDGDLIYGIVHAHDTVKSLMKYSKEHQQKFMNILNSKVEGNDKQLIRLGDYLKDRKIVGGIDLEENKVILESFDATGMAQRTFADLGSVEAQTAMGNNFKTMTSLFGGVNLHDPTIITDKYVQSRIDQIGTISLSKNSIGIFENLVSTRKKQILEMDTFKKYNTERLSKIMGNVWSGFGGMAQGAITLGKHGNIDTIKQLTLVVQSLTSTTQRDAEADDALKNWLKGLTNREGKRLTPQLFDDTEVDSIHRALTVGIQEHYSRLGPKEQAAYQAEQIRIGMDLGKDISPFMELMANAPQNLTYQPVAKASLLPKPEFPMLKKAGKFGAIGAAIVLAGNFFSPNRLSNSLNPMHAFTDLGVDLDGDNNSIFAELELERDVPIDTVNPSFSKKAFIRVNELTNSRRNEERSTIISNAIRTGFDNTNPFIHEWRTPPNLTYTNYTSNINYLGSSQLERRYKY